MDQEDDLEAALVLYRSALEYLIPLVTNEKNAATKMSLRKKADQYIKRAEDIKKSLGLISSTEKDFSRSISNSKSEELVKLSRNTPALKNALEIALSAELYDAEGQLEVAFEKYQSALGLLLPLLTSEPKGERKTLLSQQIKHWMSRAETIRDIQALEDKAAIGDAVDGKSCVLQ